MSGGREKGKILFTICYQMLSYVPSIPVKVNIIIPPTNSIWCGIFFPDHLNQPMWKTFRGSTSVLRIHRGKLFIPHMISFWTSCFSLLRHCHWLMIFSRVGPLRVWNTADRYLIVFEEHSLWWRIESVRSKKNITILIKLQWTFEEPGSRIGLCVLSVSTRPLMALPWTAVTRWKIEIYHPLWISLER